MSAFFALQLTIGSKFCSIYVSCKTQIYQFYCILLHLTLRFAAFHLAFSTTFAAFSKIQPVKAL